MKLLNVDQNAKTVKGQKQGYLTAVQYMIPGDLSGYEVCPGASKACREACLNTAGRGVFSNVQKSRLKKTKYFFEDRKNFIVQLKKEISALIRKAEKKGLIPVVRLNGTSDINYMKIKVDDDGNNIFQAFQKIQFYDYTKNFNMLSQSEKFKNYHLTFSYSGENLLHSKVALERGFNVSAVFHTALPLTLKGTEIEFLNKVPILDGEKSDLRFLDKGKNGPFIIGLVAKGKARKQNSSFII
jgi:hypothetical protein